MSAHPTANRTKSKRENYTTKNRDIVQHDVSDKQLNICTEQVLIAVFSSYLYRQKLQSYFYTCDQ